jgi:hypothetical protein
MQLNGHWIFPLLVIVTLHNGGKKPGRLLSTHAHVNQHAKRLLVDLDIVLLLEI